MATLTCRCPFCEAPLHAELIPQQPLVCAQCGKTLTPRIPELIGQRLEQCLVCPSGELFVRKDFPQQLGVAIVVGGFIASSVTWYFHQILATYGILFGTALVDVVLYLLMGNVVECYRCHAQYRGLAPLEAHAAFNLETHERYRQEAVRRREQAIQPSRPSAAP